MVGETVGARVIVVGCDLRSVIGVEPENRVSEVAAVPWTSAPEVCGVVAEIGLSGECGRHLDHNEVVASLSDQRLVGIWGAVVTIGAVDDGERHEADPKEQERDEPHLPACDWKYARSVPIPPTPSSAPSAFKTVKPPFIWSISDWSRSIFADCVSSRSMIASTWERVTWNLRLWRSWWFVESAVSIRAANPNGRVGIHGNDLRCAKEDRVVAQELRLLILIEFAGDELNDDAIGVDKSESHYNPLSHIHDGDKRTAAACAASAR
jgi:hypothetical protein